MWKHRGAGFGPAEASAKWHNSTAPGWTPPVCMVLVRRCSRQLLGQVYVTQAAAPKVCTIATLITLGTLDTDRNGEHQPRITKALNVAEPRLTGVKESV